MKTVSEYSQSNVLVIPQALFSMSDVSLLMQHGGSMIFYKDLEQDLLDVEFYTNTPCAIYIKTGREVITTSDNREVKLAAGSLVYLLQGLNLHSDYVQLTESLQAYLVFFDKQVITDYLHSLKNIPKTVVAEQNTLKLEDNGTIKTYFESIQQSCSLGIENPEYVKIKLLELLQLIACQGVSEELYGLLVGSETISPNRNLARLMQKTEVLSLSVNDLATLSGRSLSSFTRDFKSIYKSTPKQWLQEKRISYAKSLLQDSQYSVTEVASQVGYENVSHFIKAFKSKCGITPKQFKLDG